MASYVLLMLILCVAVYLVFHNKQKVKDDFLKIIRLLGKFLFMPQILALVLEGRRGRGGGRTGGRRRSGGSSAQYRKLDNNLVSEIWETTVFQQNSLTRLVIFCRRRP